MLGIYRIWGQFEGSIASSPLLTRMGEPAVRHTYIVHPRPDRIDRKARRGQFIVIQPQTSVTIAEVRPLNIGGAS